MTQYGGNIKEQLRCRANIQPAAEYGPMTALPVRNPPGNLRGGEIN
jgi:hypothetical protein